MDPIPVTQRHIKKEESYVKIQSRCQRIMRGGAGKSVFRLKFLVESTPPYVRGSDASLETPMWTNPSEKGKLRNACRNPQNAIQLELTPA